MFFEAKWGRRGTAAFLISSLQIKATICLKLPDGSECWAWQGQGRHRGQLKPCGPAPVPWLKPWVLMDAEMRHLSRESLEPSRGQQERQSTLASERGTCLQSKEQQRGTGEQQHGAQLPVSMACPVPPVQGCCSPGGFPATDCGGPQAAAGERQQVTNIR